MRAAYRGQRPQREGLSDKRQLQRCSHCRRCPPNPRAGMQMPRPLPSSQNPTSASSWPELLRTQVAKVPRTLDSP